MNYVIDTITITRHFTGIGKLGNRANKIVRDAEDGKHVLFISAVSLFEILHLAEGNRIKLSLKNALAKIQAKPCYAVVDLNTEIILKTEEIPFYELHDRLILGTVKYLDLPIISSDEEFDKVEGIERIW